MTKIKQNAIERKDITILASEREFQIAAIELIDVKSIVISLYRPPTNNLLETFTEKLNDLIFSLGNEKEHKNIFICRDFIINFKLQTKIVQDVLDILNASNLKQVFHDSSRITTTSNFYKCYVV